MSDRVQTPKNAMEMAKKGGDLYTPSRPGFESELRHEDQSYYDSMRNRESMIRGLFSFKLL